MGRRIVRRIGLRRIAVDTETGLAVGDPEDGLLVCLAAATVPEAISAALSASEPPGPKTTWKFVPTGIVDEVVGPCVP